MSSEEDLTAQLEAALERLSIVEERLPSEEGQNRASRAASLARWGRFEAMEVDSEGRQDQNETASPPSPSQTRTTASGGVKGMWPRS